MYYHVVIVIYEENNGHTLKLFGDRGTSWVLSAPQGMECKVIISVVCC